ncbi:MAG: AAA family ATPase [Bryobacterales bacterium]|nr:AAA family ATPase [Bryobacterales bacterium]
MIVGISVKNFKGIQSLVRLPLSPFQVLVGPNGSGKTTFLEAIDFVKTCLEHGPLKAVEDRAPNYRDLTFLRRGGRIEIELWIDLSGSVLDYRLAISDDDRLGVRVDDELLQRVDRCLAPVPNEKFELAEEEPPKPLRLLGKTSKGTDFYQREAGRYMDSFAFGLDKLTLSHTPADETRYPTANALKRFLLQGVRFVQLNSRAMREPCSATRSTDLELDGTNLPRVVGRLIKKTNGREPSVGSQEADPLREWTDHLRYALPDLESIGWATRTPDNAEYIILKYEDGLECPNWLISDGTLRMLALTLPAFLPEPAPGVYLVEEPENGVHPKALEVILRALSTIPRSQVFIATHSPLIVQQVGRVPLLCFTRGSEGIRVVRGPDHKALKTWDGEPDLASVFAAGVLE